MKKISIVLLSLIVVLGGCSLMEPSKYTVDEIIADGKIDIRKAERTGYVTYEETKNNVKPTAKQNKKAWEYVEQNKEIIEKNMKAYIESTIGEEVEILYLDTPYPYMSVDASYQTVNEPRWKNFTTMGIEDSIAFEAGTFKEIKNLDIQQDIVSGLYRYAFSEQPEFIF